VLADDKPDVRVQDDRVGMSPDTLRRAVLDHLKYTRTKRVDDASLIDAYHAVAHTVRDRLVHRWMATTDQYAEQDVRRVYYLSAEYLLGRQLEANLLTLGLREEAARGLAEHGIELEAVLNEEEDPGLGNGGLGRLAACFLDSLATLELPAIGYGIRYEFGIFRQEISDGWQVEQPDEWLRKGNPWEVRRPEFTVSVRFGGRTHSYTDADGRFQSMWEEDHIILGVPHDTPVAGFGTTTVNTLRLWAAQASEQFDLAVFNDGDYRRAVETKSLHESISKVLYPKDSSIEGRELRLKQQYFFVCCSIHDIVRRYNRAHDDLSQFEGKVAIQLNDTHPAITVAELMRVLVDRERIGWDEAWQITRNTCSYTNHTLLPEALEKWPIDLFGRILPRHLEIIREIDRRFLREVHVWCGGDTARVARMAIVDEALGQVRMAHLSVVGSHKVNGVAELHSQLLRERVLNDFADLWPERFTNQTNGVTPRRWLLQANPLLSAEITERIGDGWVTDLSQLKRLAPLATDASFLDALQRIKHQNKSTLAELVSQRMDLTIDPEAIFDVQVKRIHEYKRQLMCALHAVWLYWRIRFNGESIVPRVVMFGGKAAPGYAVAKRHIKIIHDIAAHLRADPVVDGQLQVLFLANYNVSMAERVIPAADLSEQISLAGKEASGTGNMKFQMNGALTIGTLDGANLEIRQEVGAENFFLFGLDAEEVRERKLAGYVPAEVIAGSERLQRVLGLLEEGFLNPDERGLHAEVAAYLRYQDPYLVCADFDDYCDAQERAAVAYTDPGRWWPMVARNIAAGGKFSSDRTIRGYAKDIWRLTPSRVTLPGSESS